MQRRHLLQAGALAGLGWTQLGQHAWCARSDTLATAHTAPRRLVVVFLRGAVDGLNVVAPYAEADYRRWRPTIGLNAPGASDGALDLDGHFGLHPSLSTLMPMWQSGRLGFVHASGSPDPTRSHFDAQDYMESGTPGRKATADGWLNRLLGALPAGATPSSPTRAVSIGPVLPRIYAGSNTVATIPSGAAAVRPTLLDRPRIGEAFAQLYGGHDRLSQAYQASQQAHREVMASMDRDALEQEMQAANNGAPLPNGFADDAARLGVLMRKDASVQLAFMAVGGWDTHANQGAGTGQLAGRLAPLGQGLAALAQRLGPVFDDTVVLVMSEFGRTVRQNGNGGTDHGHGNVMWLMGGPVRGGRVHGDWPGLDAAALYEGRDLAVTTDFRDVLAQLCTHHLGLSDVRLDQVLPAYRRTSSRALQLLQT
jgi:uncharacterized protein (DUF1501 family)